MQDVSFVRVTLQCKQILAYKTLLTNKAYEATSHVVATKSKKKPKMRQEKAEVNDA